MPIKHCWKSKFLTIYFFHREQNRSSEDQKFFANSWCCRFKKITFRVAWQVAPRPQNTPQGKQRLVLRRDAKPDLSKPRPPSICVRVCDIDVPANVSFAWRLIWSVVSHLTDPIWRHGLVFQRLCRWVLPEQFYPEQFLSHWFLFVELSS